MAAGTQGSHVAHSNQMKFVYDFFCLSVDLELCFNIFIRNRGSILSINMFVIYMSLYLISFCLHQIVMF